MTKTKLIIIALPWILLAGIIVALYPTNHAPFGKDNKSYHVESTVILQEIESLGKLELVRYNVRDIFDYKELSEGKIIMNSLFNTTNYSPDMRLMLVVAGEVVGCIDLTKIKQTDIQLTKDTLFVYLPPPEICYHKIDFANSKILSFDNGSWWSRLFTDQSKTQELTRKAFQHADSKIMEAAIESGILNQVNQQATSMLTPLLETLTSKKAKVIVSIPSGLLLE